nr:hypothetical protein GCM10023233_19180 [Brevibacterium otitidis]
MQHPSAAPATGRDDPARRAPGRRRRARDSHDQQPVAAVDVLNMNAIETKQQVATRARAGGGGRISAPRSRVKHVEVLVVDQVVSASDPRGPRPLPANQHPANLTPTGCPKSHLRVFAVK